MKWNTGNKYRMNVDREDITPTLGPFIINTEQAQTSSEIRVVENTIFFYDEVSDGSILELNRILKEVDIKLQNTKNVLGDSFTPIIHLRLKTFGGEIYAALATLDMLTGLKSKVYTYIDGCVASAGTLISVAGDKRFMGRRASLLIHQLSGDMYGKFTEMEDTMETCVKLMKCLKDIYKEYTKIPMKRLDELFKRDIYLSAQECLDYGIIDEII